MLYRTTRDLRYMLNGTTQESVIIPAGEDLRAIEVNQMPSRDQTVFKRMQKRQLAKRRSTRLIFFEYKGVIRSAVAGDDVVLVTRRRRRR